jgi:hypothetical protein
MQNKNKAMKNYFITLLNRQAFPISIPVQSFEA